MTLYNQDFELKIDNTMKTLKPDLPILLALVVATTASAAQADLRPSINSHAGIGHLELRREQRGLDQNRGGRILDALDTRLSGETLTLGGELAWTLLPVIQAYTSASLGYTNRAEFQMELASFQNGERVSGDPERLESLTMEQAAAGLRWQQSLVDRLSLQASLAFSHNVWRARQRQEAPVIVVDGNNNITAFGGTVSTMETADSFTATHLQAALTYALTRNLDAQLSAQLQKGDEYEGAFAGLVINYRL